MVRIRWFVVSTVLVNVVDFFRNQLPRFLIASVWTATVRLMLMKNAISLQQSSEHYTTESAEFLFIYLHNKRTVFSFVSRLFIQKLLLVYHRKQFFFLNSIFLSAFTFRIRRTLYIFEMLKLLWFHGLKIKNLQIIDITLGHNATWFKVNQFFFISFLPVAFRFI